MRGRGQVVPVTGEDAQVMDLETYQTFTIRIPDGEDLNPEDRVEYLRCEDQRKIV